MKAHERSSMPGTPSRPSGCWMRTCLGWRQSARTWATCIMTGSWRTGTSLSQHSHFERQVASSMPLHAMVTKTSISWLAFA